MAFGHKALNGRRTLERVLNGRREKVFVIKCHSATNVSACHSLSFNATKKKSGENPTLNSQFSILNYLVLLLLVREFARFNVLYVVRNSLSHNGIEVGITT